MIGVIIITPTGEPASKTVIGKITAAMRDTYGITDQFLIKQDDRINDPLILAATLEADPTQAVVLVIGEEFMPLYDKAAMEYEIIPLLHYKKDRPSFETLAQYILPILQKSIAKAQAEKKTNE